MDDQYLQQATQKAIESIGEDIWNSLPDIVKQQMIEGKKKEIESKKREMETEKRELETEKRELETEKRELEILKEREEIEEKSKQIEEKQKEVEKQAELLRSEAELLRSKEEQLRSEFELATRQRRVEEEKLQIESERIDRANKLISDVKHLSKHISTVDVFTPSVYTLQQSTRSKLMLESTKEFIETRNEVVDKVENNDMSVEEGKEIVESKLKELQRIMDNRRQRERYASGKTVKKTVQENVSHMRQKGKDTSSYSIDEFEHTTIVHHANIAVRIPSKDEMEAKFNEQKHTCEEQSKKLTHPIYGNSVCLFLKGNKFFHSYTRTMITVDSDGNPLPDWYDKLCEDIKSKLVRVSESDNYELEDLEIECLSVHSHYYIQQIESIENWYKNKVDLIMTFKDFKLFTANDPNIPCIQQVIEYFGEVFNEDSTIEDMLAPRKVIYGHPAKGSIEQVKEYADFVWDYHEDMATTDCVNFARIIRWNEHVGVVTYIKPKRLIVNKGLQRKQINTTNHDCIDIFVDIEAFASSSPGKYLISTPYLVCWTVGSGPTDFPSTRRFSSSTRQSRVANSSERVAVLTGVDKEKDITGACEHGEEEPCDAGAGRGEASSQGGRDSHRSLGQDCPYGEGVPRVKHAKGPGCVEQFVIQLLENNIGKEICLYAWYGSGYDYQHIYKHLKKRCTDDNTFVRNNAIIYSKMTFDDYNITLHLKDPFLFILCSLDKAAKAFECLTKGSFPHEVVHNFEDLDKVITDWYIVRSEVVETIDMESNGKRLLITAKNHDEIIERDNLKTIMEKALEYCTVDVIAMQQIWSKFTKLVKTNLQTEIDPQTFTLSQMSMKIMTAMLPPKVTLSIPDLDEYNFLKSALYGGRVKAINGVYEEAIYYADVVSLYPSAMRLLEHPAGNYTKVNQINWNRNGIYEVILTSKFKPKDYMSFVPFRDEKGNLTYDWRPYWKGRYHIYDLMIAKEQGYNIKCIEGLEWGKSYLFNKFIDKLFKMKADNTGPIRNIAKIALNGGGYGKFVQKPINSNVHIVEKGIVQGHFDRLEPNSEGLIVKAGITIERPDFYPLDDEWDKMVIEDPEATPHYPTQVGISILSGSRYRLYKLIKNFCHRHTSVCEANCDKKSIEVIYSDTDSIFVKASSVDKSEWISRMGNDLGQLDDTLNGIKHGIIDRMYIAGPKMYAYEYHDERGMAKNVCHMKGIRSKDLKIDHFKHLLQSENHRLVYNMTVMSKNLVGVKMAEIDKIIKQT